MNRIGADRCNLAFPRLGYRNGGAAWSPAALFDGGQAGHWPGGYDPAAGRMWQDSAGSLSAVSPGQPVGLVLDNSQGAALGGELLVNGDFAASTGWTMPAGATISGGKLNLSSVGSGQQVWQAFTGDGTFEVVIVIDSISAGAIQAWMHGPGAAGPNLSTPGTHICRLTGSAIQRLGLRVIGVTTAVISSVSYRRIAGYHAYQATALSRPTLQQTGGIWHLSNDGGDSLAVSLPSGTYGRAWVDAAGVVSVDTVTDPTNALIPTAVNATQADVILRQGAFSADEETSIRAYWAERYAA